MMYTVYTTADRSSTTYLYVRMYGVYLSIFMHVSQQNATVFSTLPYPTIHLPHHRAHRPINLSTYQPINLSNHPLLRCFFFTHSGLPTSDRQPNWAGPQLSPRPREFYSKTSTLLLFLFLPPPHTDTDTDIG